MPTKDELIAHATELGLETEGMSKAQLTAAIDEALAEDETAEDRKAAVLAPETVVPAAPVAEKGPGGTSLYLVKNQFIAAGIMYHAGDVAPLTLIQVKPLLKYGAVVPYTGSK
jgi:hypothetical protein